MTLLKRFGDASSVALRGMSNQPYMPFLVSSAYSTNVWPALESVTHLNAHALVYRFLSLVAIVGEKIVGCKALVPYGSSIVRCAAALWLDDVNPCV